MAGAIFTHTRTIGASGADHTTPQLWDDYAPGVLANTWRVSIGAISSGPFAAGESLSFSSSGATGTYLDDDGSQMVFEVLTGAPTTSDTISGASASCPLNSIDDDLGIVYKGNLKDEEFGAVTIDGSTTAVGTYKHLTADGASGFESFIDHKNDVGFKLAYNSSGGARLRSTAIVVLLSVNENYTLCDRLQIDAAGTYTNAAGVGGANTVFKKCLVQGSPIAAFTGLWINCLCLPAATGHGFKPSYGGTMVNCTSVRRSSITADGEGFNHNSTGDRAVQCAAFNYTDAFDPVPGWHSDSDWNASDDTTGPGANTLDSLTYADQYVDDDGDWLLKSGSALRDAGESTHGEVPSEDILENPRPAGGASNPVAIGCVEFIAAGGGGLSIPIAAYHYNHNSGSMI